ncbi:MAG TPA: ATP-binding protein [Thermoanaerobaculia bacterium]|nr:ATP-binding protein [Thermoanaerobaculia bacterium]
MAIKFHQSELKFGSVREVDGASVTILADELSRKHSGVEYAVELGSFVLIASPQSDLIATVSAIRMQEISDKGTSVERRLVVCTLVGFLRDGVKFERGIERYPTVGSAGYLMTADALDSMFTSTDQTLEVGERCQRGGGKEQVLIDKMFGRHTAVLGTSGAGKSWTVASLLQTAMERLPHTRIVFLDLHDEYRTAFPEAFKRLGRKVRHIASADLRIPHWALNAEELEALFVSRESTAANQSALFRTVIKDLRRPTGQAAGLADSSISVDTPVYFSFEEFLNTMRAMDIEMVAGAKGEKQGPWYGKLSNLVMRMESRFEDPRYHFLFGDTTPPGTRFEDVLSNLFGADGSVQMTIIDLSGLPSEVLSIIVGVLGRLAFEYKYWDTDPNLLPLTLVLEEAHNYLPRSADASQRVCLDRIERIAKEGRKYGINMFVVSQRPSEVSETVLSQCGNFVVLRLTNPADQAYVRRLLPDFLAVAVDMLPYLRTGEAVLSGEAVEVPTRVRVTTPDPHPRSNDVRYRDGWSTGLPSDYSPAVVVNRWRKRTR